MRTSSRNECGITSAHLERPLVNRESSPTAQDHHRQIMALVNVRKLTVAYLNDVVTHRLRSSELDRVNVLADRDRIARYESIEIEVGRSPSVLQRDAGIVRRPGAADAGAGAHQKRVGQTMQVANGARSPTLTGGRSSASDQRTFQSATLARRMDTELSCPGT